MFLNNCFFNYYNFNEIKVKTENIKKNLIQNSNKL